METACALAVCQWNDGMSSFQAISDRLGIALTSHSATHLHKRVIDRLRKARYRTTDRAKALRRKAQKIRKVLDDTQKRKEGDVYGPGKFYFVDSEGGRIRKGKGKAGGGGIEKGKGKAGGGGIEMGKGKAGGGGIEKGKAGGGGIEKGKGKDGGGGIEKGKGKAGGGGIEKGKGKAGGGGIEKGKGKAGGGAIEKGKGKAGSGAIEKGKGKAGGGAIEKGKGKAGGGGIEKNDEFSGELVRGRKWLCDDYQVLPSKQPKRCEAK